MSKYMNEPISLRLIDKLPDGRDNVLEFLE